MEETRKHLLDDFQRDFPLVARPFEEIAQRVGMTEQAVIDAYDDMLNEKYVSRIGAVVTPNRVGCSTLAAMAVEPDRLEEIANQVSAFERVNHNYEREHRFNLWFVVTADSADELDAILALIEKKTGHDVMSLPMQRDYHLDLGFKLEWS